MTDWGWVTLAFSIVYGTLVAYVTILARRDSRLRRSGRQG
jgi:acyl-coenzyme A synthetase/AMP-(fatty) acid ligase